MGTVLRASSRSGDPRLSMTSQKMMLIVGDGSWSISRELNMY